jgi:DNA polymerase III sliding clamp (beta) subunit (PCNA family)
MKRGNIKMRIKTEILQKMVSKAIQGSSNNKMIPLTSLIGIEFKEDILGGKGSLILTTTDGSNQFKVNHTVEGTGEFYTIVNAETFSKLVGKTTKEFIELENKKN